MERLHVDATIIRSLQKVIFAFPTVDVRHAVGTLAWQRPSLGDSCKSGKMATLLNSLFSVSNIMIIVKWCNGI